MYCLRVLDGETSRRKILLRALAYTIACVAACLESGTAFAAPHDASQIIVQVPSREDAASAIGIVFSAHGVEQTEALSISRFDPDTLLVAIAVPKAKSDSHAEQSGMATALVVTNSGSHRYGHVRTIGTQDGAAAAMKTVPPCPQEKASLGIYPSQLGMLETLVTNRARQRSLETIKVAKIMNEDFLEKLKDIERKFGLGGERELVSDLPPIELIDRLSRILAALRTFRRNLELREKAPVAAASPS